MATAGGLVFEGNGAGKELRAYDAKNGEHAVELQGADLGVCAADHLRAGWRAVHRGERGRRGPGGYYAPGYARMLVFAIGGTATLPPNQPYTPPPLDPPPSTASADVISHGGELYSQYCSVCHGQDGVQTRGTFPNLMVTPMLHSQEAFDQVVLQGVRQEKGMGNFSKDLKPEDSAAVREYLISRANVLKSAGPAARRPSDNTGNQHQATEGTVRVQAALCPGQISARGTRPGQNALQIQHLVTSRLDRAFALR